MPTGFAFPQRRLPAAPALRLDSLPAQLLAQRPDLHAAHQQWLAAVHASRAADAQAYPQLSLSGLIGRAELRLGGSSSSGAIGSGAALLSLLAVRHEHSLSWIDLYRALGGGWSLEQAGDS